MKADKEWLEEVLGAGLEERRAGGGAECPPSDDLVRLVTREAGRKERRRTLDHVAGCGECAQILRSLLRLSDEVDRITGKAEPRKKPMLIRGRRAALAALAGLAGLLVVTYAVIRLTERPVVRGTTGVEVRLVSPKAGAALAGADIELRWEAVPKAAGYRVELFDRSLAKLWGSAALTEVRLRLPAEARATLHEGETYFWRVTATLDDGQELQSKLAEFSIRKQP
jgi:hypothetical protein